MDMSNNQFSVLLQLKHIVPETLSAKLIFEIDMIERLFSKSIYQIGGVSFNILLNLPIIYLFKRYDAVNFCSGY